MTARWLVAGLAAFAVLAGIVLALGAALRGYVAFDDRSDDAEQEAFEALKNALARSSR